MNLTTDGVLEAGFQFSITCDATRDNRTAEATLRVEWLYPDNTVITSGEGGLVITGNTSTNTTSLTSTLTFSSLLTSQGGSYVCRVYQTIPDVVTDHPVEATYYVTVQSELVCLNITCDKDTIICVCVCMTCVIIVWPNACHIW